MTTTVLAYFPSPAQGVWYLGPFPIRAYALCIIAGIIAALLIGDRRWAARGGERGVIYDVALWAVPFGLIGGRLYHVLTDWKTYFGPGGAGPIAALRIWEGGLGIWGAVALGAVGAWIGCRRKGIPLPAFGDAVAPGIVLAQAIGRLGNYFNQELYGRETTVPWGMEVFYRRDASGALDVHSLDGVSTGQVAAVVHPTFLYELLWNLLVFVLLIWADRRFRLGHGRLFALYVAAYCVGRFWVELMRDDTATHIAGIRINVFTATFVFIGAVVYLLLAPKGREDPETLRGWVPLEDEDDEESIADGFAGDLVAAAKGSGILAAATVAGDHEAEDSDAVGDVEAADGDTEVIEAVDAEAGGVELVEADGADFVEADDSTVVVYSGEAEGEDGAAEEVVVVAEDAEVPEDTGTAVVEDAETAVVEDAPGAVVEDGEAAVVEEAETVVVDHDPGAAETVVVDHEPETAETVVVDHEPETAETVVVDHEPEAAETVVVDHEPETAETVVVDHEPETAETVVVENESEIELSELDADSLTVEHIAAEAESEVRSAEVEVEVEAEASVEAGDEESAADAETPAEAPVAPEPAAVEKTPAPPGQTPPAPTPGPSDDPKLGSTLKRLLWGAGNRGGK